MLLPWRETVGVAWEAVAERVLTEARRRGARLIVVDTLGQFAGLEGDSENNSGDALRAMKPLQQIAAEGLGVIVVRHERKMGSEVGDSGRGSSAYAGAVDIVISLRRVEGGQSSGVRMLRSISRFPDTPDDLAVELGDEGYRALGSAKEAYARRIEDTVLAALPKSEETAIPDNDICPNSELSRSSVKRGLDRLIAQGLAARTGLGRTKHPFRYWATTP